MSNIKSGLITNCWLLISYTNNILKEDPENINTLILKGKIYIILGEFKLAIDTFEKALEYSPNNAFVHYRLGQLLWRYGSDIEVVLYHFKKAMHLRPEEATYVASYAEALSLTGNMSDAITYARISTILSPNTMDYQLLLNDLLMYY
jgi:tetratricopeptide (TPR) repeat protein